VAEHEKTAGNAQQRVAELEAENASLRAQLSAVGQGRVASPAHRFFLTEANRQELELRGYTVVGGELLDAAEVKRRLAGTPQAGVDIADAPKAAQGDAARLVASVRRDDQGSQYGVTHVYPSVRPGQIDPAVAGTPGISGPAATGRD
jgi:hypothetical protein